MDGDARDEGPACPTPHRRPVLILTALGAVAVAVIAIAIAMIDRTTDRPSQSCSARSTTVIAPPTLPSSSDMQTVLLFCGPETPDVVAVDGARNVYVVTNGSRMLKLAPGSTEPTMVAPFAGFVGMVHGVADGSAGALYAADRAYGCVWKLALGATALEKMPFTGVRNPEGVAVDRAGAVYVSDTGNRRILRLAVSKSQEVLPFTELHGPHAVAVDSTGAVYVLDANQVLKLPAGAGSSLVLPVTGLVDARGLTVDNTGVVYVVDRSSNSDSRVVKLAAGATHPEVLPATNLAGSNSVAVDNADAVYVADPVASKVVKLTPR